jgi:hypothetical protein
LPIVAGVPLSGNIIGDGLVSVNAVWNLGEEETLEIASPTDSAIQGMTNSTVKGEGSLVYISTGGENALYLENDIISNFRVGTPIGLTQIEGNGFLQIEQSLSVSDETSFLSTTPDGFSIRIQQFPFPESAGRLWRLSFYTDVHKNEQANSEWSRFSVTLLCFQCRMTFPRVCFRSVPPSGDERSPRCRSGTLANASCWDARERSRLRVIQQHGFLLIQATGYGLPDFCQTGEHQRPKETT